jgi:hypothetical protein
MGEATELTSSEIAAPSGFLATTIATTFSKAQHILNASLRKSLRHSDGLILAGRTL